MLFSRHCEEPIIILGDAAIQLCPQHYGLLHFARNDEEVLF
jgi:hypothetical protein